MWPHSSGTRALSTAWATPLVVVTTGVGLFSALVVFFFFFQAEDRIRDHCVTGVQTCAPPICADNRSWPDLYVASCGYQHAPTSRLLQDRLYINQGGGKFVRDAQALPEMLTCTASVTAGDFNGDGRPDLFVGGRLMPRNYPSPTRSYLLRNDGGRFTDVTSELAPELAQPLGMITAAVWVDYDGDGRLDLVTAGEWMPLEFWHNDGKRLTRVSVGLPPTRD